MMNAIILKKWGVVEQGLFFFQEFADIYGDSINDLECLLAAGTNERFYQN